MTMQEYDTAIVVFVRAEGADERDAQDRAAITIRHALGAGGGRGRLPAQVEMPRWIAEESGDTVTVANVMELGMALGNGYAWARVTSKAFSEFGMEKPGG